jgi:hypothetical protein
MRFLLLLFISLSILALFPLQLTPSAGLPLSSLPLLSLPYPNGWLRVRRSRPNDRLRVISGNIALLATLSALFFFFQALLILGLLSYRDPLLSQKLRLIILAMLEGARTHPELPTCLPVFAFPFRLNERWAVSDYVAALLASLPASFLFLLVLLLLGPFSHG